MQNYFLYPIAFIVMLGVLVIIHEFGHYIIAKLCGIKVLRFSVGFGKIIYKKNLTKDNTEFALSLIPLGGYVKMLDKSEKSTLSDNEKQKISENDWQTREFSSQPIGKRAAVIAAGASFNFLLAIFLYFVLALFGLPDYLPVVADPPKNSIAYQQNLDLQSGDQILEINGKNIATWSDLRWELLQNIANKNENVTLKIKKNDGNLVEKNLFLGEIIQNKWTDDTFEKLGINVYRPRFKPVIGEVVKKSPADHLGLKIGDKIVRINEQNITHWEEISETIKNSPKHVLEIVVQRNNRFFVVFAENSGYLGIGLGKNFNENSLVETPKNISTTIHYNFLEAAIYGVVKTYEMTAFSLKMLGKMIIGDVSPKNLSGPISIADFSGKAASAGLMQYFQFMALISLSLGLLNLLPIPVLDGGHLLFLAIEKIRGSALPDSTLIFFQKIGMAFILILSIYAIFNDINRVFL